MQDSSITKFFLLRIKGGHMNTYRGDIGYTEKTSTPFPFKLNWI